METNSGSDSTKWKTIALKDAGIDVIDGDRGKEYPKEDDFQGTGHCLFLNAKNVTKTGFRFQECSYISEDKDRKLGKGKLKKNDLVITTRGTIGNIAWYSDFVPLEHIRINSGMAVLRPNGGEVDAAYLYQLFSSRVITSQIDRLSFGSAQPQLTIGIIEKLKIPLPSKNEQRKIAEILSCWDRAINIIEKLTLQTIAEYNQSVNSLFQHKKGHNEVPLIQLCTIRTGKKDVNEGNPGGVYRFYTCAKQHTFSDSYSFDDEAILVSGNGVGVGYCHYYVGKFEAYQRTYVLTGFSQVTPRYLLHFLKKNLRRAIAKEKQDSAMPYIRLGLLQNMAIPIRSLEEQLLVAEALDMVNLKIEKLQSLLSLYQSQKQALMQKLLTGKIRVKV